MAYRTLAESFAIISTVDPDAQSASAVNTDVIDMKNFRQVMFIIATGTLGASATVDFVVKGDTTSGGSFSTTITGKSITQLVKASHDASQSVINVTAEEAAAQGYRYLRGTLTVGTAASEVGCIVLGELAHYTDARDNDLASVVEVIL